MNPGYTIGWHVTGVICVSVCNEPWLHHWVACYRCDTQSGGASSRVSAECLQLPPCHF